MNSDQILAQLTEGTTLEGPHWTEPVKVLTAKSRGSRIEVQAVGTHTQKLWKKLLRKCGLTISRFSWADGVVQIRAETASFDIQ